MKINYKDYYYKYKALKYYLKNKQIKGGANNPELHNFLQSNPHLRNLTVGELQYENQEHINLINLKGIFNDIPPDKLINYVKNEYKSLNNNLDYNIIHYLKETYHPTVFINNIVIQPFVKNAILNCEI